MFEIDVTSTTGAERTSIFRSREFHSGNQRPSFSRVSLISSNSIQNMSFRSLTSFGSSFCRRRPSFPDICSAITFKASKSSVESNCMFCIASVSRWIRSSVLVLKIVSLASSMIKTPEFVPVKSSRSCCSA